jgi:(1->4)-alpha-D-glucan 1-alpha-D-glucosylmutase
LEQFVGRLRAAGQINSLAQTLVKLTAPGVPDIYQGSEIWDFSLVDPDNRRPVDFKLRQRLLYEAMHLEAESIWARRDEGLPKLWMIQRTLALRAQHHGIFNDAFEPMIARGERANHLIAFVRAGRFLTAIPRFVLELNGNWADTSLELPPGVWNNEFTGEAHRGETMASDLFKNFPVTLLVKTEGK